VRGREEIIGARRLRRDGEQGDLRVLTDPDRPDTVRILLPAERSLVVSAAEATAQANALLAELEDDGWQVDHPDPRLGADELQEGITLYRALGREDLSALLGDTPPAATSSLADELFR